MTLKERAGIAGQFVSSRPDWLLERFARLPMTNFLYVLAGYLWVRTQSDYHYAMIHATGWSPSAEWLVGLGALTGGAITQWVKKRTTDHTTLRIQRGLEDAPQGSQPPITDSPSSEPTP